MKKIKILICFIISIVILSGCKKEDNFSTLNLNFRNEVDSAFLSNKVFFLENYTTARDTMVFDLLAGEEMNIAYKYNPKGGEGEYILVMGEKEVSFSYYPITSLKNENNFYF